MIEQGEAFKAYAKPVKMSAEIQVDISELNLIVEKWLDVSHNVTRLYPSAFMLFMKRACCHVQHFPSNE
jgi:hypothetical protein